MRAVNIHSMASQYDFLLQDDRALKAHEALDRLLRDFRENRRHGRLGVEVTMQDGREQHIQKINCPVERF